jgi:hypothetical protein
VKRQPYSWPWAPHGKLSLAEVEQIRCRLRGHAETYSEIGKRFGVSKATVSRIANGQAWVTPQ